MSPFAPVPAMVLLVEVVVALWIVGWSFVIPLYVLHRALYFGPNYTTVVDWIKDRRQDRNPVGAGTRITAVKRWSHDNSRVAHKAVVMQTTSDVLLFRWSFRDTAEADYPLKLSDEGVTWIRGWCVKPEALQALECAESLAWEPQL